MSRYGVIYGLDSVVHIISTLCFQQSINIHEWCHLWSRGYNELHIQQIYFNTISHIYYGVIYGLSCVYLDNSTEIIQHLSFIL